MSTMKLVVDPVWPSPVVLFAIVVLLFIVLTTYRQRLEPLSPGYRRLLVSLRLASIAVLAFAMFRPALHLPETDERTVSFLVVGDASRSMGVSDGPDGRTRRQVLVDVLQQAQPQLDELGERLEVLYFDAAADLTAHPDPPPEATGEQTAIGAVLETLVRESQSRRIFGVLYLSDGAQRALPPNDADPRAVARTLAAAQVPVHTIGIGTTSLSGATLDLAVEDLLVDPVAFEKKAVPITARIRAVGAAGRTLTVRLLMEDRTGRRLGEAGELKPIPATSSSTPVVRITPRRDTELIPVELTFVPELAGEFKLALEVVPLDEELLTRNNRRETIVTVRKGGLSVAYFDRVRPEQRFVRGINDSDKIQLDYHVVLPSGAAGTTPAPDAAWFEPDKYDVYIIGDVAASAFGPRLLQELARRVEEGSGLMMTGGFQSFGGGGYGQTPLAAPLPVAMTAAEVQAEGSVNAQNHLLDALQMLPTDLGQQRFVMRLAAPAENRARWAALPPLQGANRLVRKNPAVEVWAETADGAPLLLAHEYGRARVIALAADTTYLWWLGGHEEEHQRFWRQAILWLARKELEGDQPIWAAVDPRNFLPGQSPRITFGAETPEGQPIDDAEFRVTVVAPGGEEFELAPQRSGDESFADFIETQAPGDYWVKVEANQEGQSLGLPAETRFVVDARDLELDNPAADLALLQELSTVTGGNFMAPEELQDFLDRLLERESFSRFTATRSVPLWDNWWILLLFVGLMTAEWFVRKNRGLV